MTNYECGRALVYIAEQIIKTFGKDFGLEVQELKQESAEPRIKDEKVQKAIRAFCEVTQEKKRIFVIKQFGRGSAEFSVGGRYAIRLPLSYESMDALEDGRNYTLTELCGEEE